MMTLNFFRIFFISLIAVVVLFVIVGIVFGNNNVTICHKNNGNGWTEISVNENAVDGQGNGDHNSGQHQGGMDIIPPGPWDLDGRNWDPEQVEQVYNNHCVLVVPTPSPSPTITPTPSPSSTLEPSVEPTPTPSPSVSPSPTPEPECEGQCEPEPSESPSPTPNTYSQAGYWDNSGDGRGCSVNDCSGNVQGNSTNGLSPYDGKEVGWK